MVVGISIVNYKTADLVIDCLQSLCVERDLIDFQVILVDNDSQDGSFEKISLAIQSRGWAEWIDIIEAEYNAGFAYGNNIAIRQFMKETSPPEFIYLLNPDAYVRPGAVLSLFEFIQGNPNVGIAGGRIESEDGSVQNSSFRFHSFITELNRGFSLALLEKKLRPWLSDAEMPVYETKTDWVSGASMMIRSTVINDIGLLDESYFMYFEETDFCMQASRVGWECWYVPKSRIVHYVGQSSGISGGDIKEKRRPAYWFNSRRRFFLKNYGVFYAITADIFWMVGFSTWLFRNLFQRKSNNYPPYFLYDTLMNSVFVKGAGISPAKK